MDFNTVYTLGTLYFTTLYFTFFEPSVRIELTTPSLPRKCSTPELPRLISTPKAQYWAEDRARTGHLKLGRLPLYQMSYFRWYLEAPASIFKRTKTPQAGACRYCGQSRFRTYVLRREQIYSLSPLTTRPSAQTKEPKKGVEPPTCWLQISCSTNWATSAYFQELFPII